MNTFVVKVFGGLSLLGFIATGNAMSLERLDKVSQRVSKKLELNSDQQEKFQNLIISIKNETQAFKKKKRHNKFKSIANKENISKEEILDQFDKYHEQKKAVLGKILPEAIEFKSSLSQKQKLRFNKVLRRLMKKVGGKWS